MVKGLCTEERRNSYSRKNVKQNCLDIFHIPQNSISPTNYAPQGIFLIFHKTLKLFPKPIQDTSKLTKYFSNGEFSTK